MPHVVTDKIAVDVSKLFKDHDDQQYVLSEEQVATLEQVIEATIIELINDPSLIVEVGREVNR